MRERVIYISFEILCRMKKEPSLYNITVDKLQADPDLEQHRADIVHTASFLLEKCGLVKYDRKFGHLQVLKNLN